MLAGQTLGPPGGDRRGCIRVRTPLLICEYLEHSGLLDVQEKRVSAHTSADPDRLSGGGVIAECVRMLIVCPVSTPSAFPVGSGAGRPLVVARLPQAVHQGPNTHYTCWAIHLLCPCCLHARTLRVGPVGTHRTLFRLFCLHAATLLRDLPATSPIDSCTVLFVAHPFPVSKYLLTYKIYQFIIYL